MEEKRLRLDCMVHSGIRAEIDDLKESDRDQWDKIGVLQTSKASSSQMRWVIGIFLIVSMAVVGFLWRSQVAGTSSIINKIEVSDMKREDMSNKLEIVKEKVNEMKWSLDNHLEKPKK